MADVSKDDPGDVEMVDAGETAPQNELNVSNGNPSASDNSTAPAPAPAADLRQTQSPAPAPLPAAPVYHNDPNFKFKYPEANPTPPNIDDVTWNKIFTAADSRMYNKHGKDAGNSRKYRQSGETRVLALRMLEEKKAKEAAGIPPRATPKPRNTMPKKPAVKKENIPFNFGDDIPIGDMSMSISEKIKAEGRHRQSASSNSGTPAPSFQKTSSPVPAYRVEKPKKKGIAAPVKKPQPRKSIEANIGTPASSARASQTPVPTTASSPYSDSDMSNNGKLYCVCRRPDDHRLMIECAGCKEWFHPPCMKILEADVRSGLVDTFVCPDCRTSELHTTYRRLCRYSNCNDGCRMPARVGDEVPSKYCSSECAEKFWRFVWDHVRADKQPSMGGALNQQEVGALLLAAPTAAQFHALGQKPRLPAKEGADLSRPIGLDYITPEEELLIADLTSKKQAISDQIDRYERQGQLLALAHERAKLVQSKMGPKEKSNICGYDSRLAFDRAQFAEWYESNEAKQAFSTGVLGPRTSETMHIDYEETTTSHEPIIPAGFEAFADMCWVGIRKCKHYKWREVQNQEFCDSRRILAAKLKKLENKINEIIDDAETREATKSYHAGNYVEVLF